MNDQTLKSMLRRADESAPAGVPTSAARVRARAGQRAATRRRMVGMGVAAAIVIAFLLMQRVSLRSNPASPKTLVRTGGSDPAAAREIALLSAQANLQEKTIAALLRAEGRVRQQTATGDLLAKSDSQDGIAEVRNRAAQIMMDGGERLAAETGDTRRAAATYQRVIELFPESRAAETATRRMAEMKG